MEITDKVREINREAAARASAALSKLTGVDVGIEIYRTEITEPERLSPTIGAEEVVVGVYLPVTGEVSGAALLTFPRDVAFALSDLLVQRAPGTTRKLTPLDESALKEVGNIVMGSYLTVLANRLQIKTVEGVPSLGSGMFGAVLDQVTTRVAQHRSSVLAVEVEFRFKATALKGHLVLIFFAEALDVIVGTLEKASVGASR